MGTTAKPCLPVSVVRADHGIWEDIPDDSFSVEKLLTNSPLEIFGSNYWLAEDRSRAEFVLDLGCEKTVNTVELVNTKSGHHGNRGTKQFRLSLSQNSEAPWEEVLQATLADPRPQTDPLPLLVRLERRTAVLHCEGGNNTGGSSISWPAGGEVLSCSHPAGGQREGGGDQN